MRSSYWSVIRREYGAVMPLRDIYLYHSPIMTLQFYLYCMTRGPHVRVSANCVQTDPFNETKRMETLPQLPLMRSVREGFLFQKTEREEKSWEILSCMLGHRSWGNLYSVYKSRKRKIRTLSRLPSVRLSFESGPGHSLLWLLTFRSPPVCPAKSLDLH
jgi:hypothetical protein